MTISWFLAEISPRLDLFSEYDRLAPGMVVAGLLFLLLICIGVAVGFGVVLYWIKRPVRVPELTGRLASRALPWQVVSIFFGMAVSLYLLTSWSYRLLFPDGGIEAHTVIFQTLVLHVPALLLLGLLFHIAGVQGKELFGIHWKRAPAALGLSGLYYLAAFPAVWFCGLFSQFLLKVIGCRFGLQDVSLALLTPASWPVQTVLFFIAIVAAPVFEEIVFRGILLPFMVRRAGFWPGILLSSLLFSGMHFHLPSVAPIFLLSIMLALAYARTQSLLVPIGMHIAFNGVSILALFLSAG
ncbi:MAG: CPBP family intramembrane metalloprotease [Pontiellaceae bacterium]|jgi:hypothetical protein|nr:CPBP family intramembrane metalloprotease [Pontiellaceae bacterium]